MPDLLAVVLMVAGTGAMIWGARKLVDQVADIVKLWRRRSIDLLDVAPAIPYDGPLISPTGGRVPESRVDLAALVAAAAVPMTDIIEAAYWRAEHPDEPEPKILADLLPEAWTIAPEPPLQAASLDPPPPPKPSKGAATTARVAIAPDTSGFTAAVRSKFDHGGLWPAGVIHVPAGMPTEYIAAHGITADTIVIEHPMTWQPLSPRKVRAKGPYDDCRHADADRENVMGMESTEPLKSFVTSCAECDRLEASKRRLRALAEQIDEITAERGAADEISEDLCRHLRNLIAEAAEIKTEINTADAAKAAEAIRQAAFAAMRKDATG